MDHTLARIPRCPLQDQSPSANIFLPPSSYCAGAQGSQCRGLPSQRQRPRLNATTSPTMDGYGCSAGYEFVGAAACRWALLYHDHSLLGRMPWDSSQLLSLYLFISLKQFGAPAMVFVSSMSTSLLGHVFPYG